jgi:serine/threonine protein kinase
VTELTSPGRVLSGRYQLVEPLARGGMATVWIADDQVLSRRVAVKILRADLAEDDALRTRFRNEAVAAAKVGHPNIVATYDTGDDDGTAYIVMELVDGPTLRRIIDDVGGLPVRDVLRIGEQVADALDAAHRAGLVHRDVKPANVLVPERGPVKVTDFGIAKAVGTDDLTRTGTVMGTARYLAPEQVNGHATDARTDVYGLGLLLFEMLCGHPPFGGDTEIATAMARLTTSAPSVRTDRPDAPAALDDVVHRCLARRPDARFESARAVHDALARVRTQPAQQPARAAPKPSPRPVAPVVRPQPASAARRKGSGWIWVMLAVLIVLGLAATAIYLGTRDTSNDGSGAAGSASAGTPVVVGTAAFDPVGDGQEDDTHVASAVDGNPSTAWSTEHYNDPLQKTKAGVGLRLDLRSAATISSVTVNTNQGGWSGDIYVSSDPGTSLDDWGDPRASGADLGTSKTFDLRGANGKYILIWLTVLPKVGDSYQLQINEVGVE